LERRNSSQEGSGWRELAGNSLTYARADASMELALVELNFTNDVATRKSTMKNYGWGQLLGSAVKGNATLRRTSCWLLAMGLVFAHASNAYAWYDRTALQSGTGSWIYGGAYAGSGQGNAFGRVASTLPPTPLNQYDDAYMNIRLPTSWHGGKGFPYYGEFYQWMQLHTNGFIVLKKTLAEKPAAEAWDTPIYGSDFVPKRITTGGGGPSVPAGIIAPWWSDWVPSSTTALIMAERNCWWYGTCTNSANDTQPYIVEWRGIYHYGGISAYSFGIRLYPVSGKIEFQYGNVIGADQWSGGNLSSAGYQRDSNTVGGEAWFNGVIRGSGWFNPNTQLTSNTVIQFTPPQFPTIYTRARDFMLSENRNGAYLNQGFRCSDYRGAPLVSNVPTDVNGVTRLSTSSTGCGVNGSWSYDNTRTQLGSKTDIFGNDIAPMFGTKHAVVAQNLRAATNVGGGPYTFITYDTLTPMPRTATSFRMDYTWNRGGSPLNATPGATNGIFGASCWPQYGQGNQADSRLVWYGKTFNYAKTLVIVPGMDPLNTSSPAAYLSAFYPVLRPLMDEGYMVAFGDFGSPSVSPRCMIDEVALWVDRASSYSGSKVSVAGISMGGVVTRNLIAMTEPWNYYYANVWDKIRAWFSIDSPHKGANIGGSETSATDSVFGMQTMLACRASGSDNYNLINSENAAAMLYHAWTTASCATWPEDDKAAMSTAWHDAYYAVIGQPSLAIPAYAIAQGDGAPNSPIYSRVGYGSLFWFDYVFPMSDARRGSYKFDWFPGSTYLSSFDVNKDDYIANLNLEWKPSFINVHSALNGSYVDSNNDGNYDQLSIGPWTAYAANDSNWPHCYLSDMNACVLRNWVRKEQGEPHNETCPGAPSVPSNVQAIACSTVLKGG
jgi:hypothetical protein